MILKTVFFITTLSLINSYYLLTSFETKKTKTVEVTHEAKKQYREVVEYLDLRKSIFEIFDYLKKKEIVGINELSFYVRDLADHNLLNMTPKQKLEGLITRVKKDQKFLKLTKLRKAWIENRLRDFSEMIPKMNMDFQAKVDEHLNSSFIPAQKVTEKVATDKKPNWEKVSLLSLVNILALGLFMFWVSRRSKTNSKGKENKKVTLFNDILSSEVKDTILNNDLNIQINGGDINALRVSHHLHYIVNEGLLYLSEIPTNSKNIILNLENTDRIKMSITVTTSNIANDLSAFLNEMSCGLSTLVPIAEKIEREIKITTNSKAQRINIEMRKVQTQTLKSNRRTQQQL
jgi:hypothetical protein